MKNPSEYFEICPLYIGPNNVNIQRNRNIFFTAFNDYRDKKYQDIKEDRNDFTQPSSLGYNPLLRSTAGLKKLYNDIQGTPATEHHLIYRIQS